MSEDKFQKMLGRLTPFASKWAREMLESINSLKVGEEEKDLAFTWILMLMLYETPYPNRVLAQKLSQVVTDILAEEDRDWLSWEQRRQIFGKMNLE